MQEKIMLSITSYNILMAKAMLRSNFITSQIYHKSKIQLMQICHMQHFLNNVRITK